MVRIRNRLHIVLGCLPKLGFCADEHGGTKRRLCRPSEDVLVNLVFVVGISASESKQVYLFPNHSAAILHQLRVSMVQDSGY